MESSNDWTSNDWWHAYYKLCTRLLGAALLANGALVVLLSGIEASVRGDYSDGLGSRLIVLLLLTLPYLPVALWPLAILPFRPPDMKRERLKAMNAFSALVILLWAPGIIEVVATILAPPIHGDGGAWGFVVLGVLIFSPVIILCARLEERYFTSVSVRLFGKGNSDEPKTVPTIAVMLILNFVQITVVHFASVIYMFSH